jgi:RimJ/RimL family protein N-acetyltransferase
MLVRRATEDDLEAIFDLYEAVAAEGRWIGAELPVDRGGWLETWRSNLQSGRSVMFVAEEGGRVLGAASLSGEGVLDLGMQVAVDHRGRGIGSALVDATIAHARSSGAYKISLQVWPHNEPARSLYRKKGFEEEGYLRRHWRRRNGALWDAVVMGLLLDDIGAGSATECGPMAETVSQGR